MVLILAPNQIGMQGDLAFPGKRAGGNFTISPETTGTYLRELANDYRPAPAPQRRKPRLGFIHGTRASPNLRYLSYRLGRIESPAKRWQRPHRCGVRPRRSPRAFTSRLKSPCFASWASMWSRKRCRYQPALAFAIHHPDDGYIGFSGLPE